MGAQIARPQAAEALPIRFARVVAQERCVDALARRVDGDVVAPRHRPAREIVFALLLHRHRIGRPSPAAKARRWFGRAREHPTAYPAASRCWRKARQRRRRCGSTLYRRSPLRCDSAPGGNRKSPRRWHRGRAHAWPRPAARPRNRDNRRARYRHARSAAASGTPPCWSIGARWSGHPRPARAAAGSALRRPIPDDARRDCPNPSAARR